MRLRDYPDLVFDEFPTLYDINTKVFITNLFGAATALAKIPMRFCKMYTTTLLASQLKAYLRARGVELPDGSFELVHAFEPFPLRLSNGLRLELMFCFGSDIENVSMVLLRERTQKLMHFYSVAQQDNLHGAVCNARFLDWIKPGPPEVLHLDLRLAHSKVNYSAQFEELGARLESKALVSKLRMILPLFGYERAIEALARQLPKRIALLGELYDMCVLAKIDMTHFCNNTNTNAARIYISAMNDAGKLLEAATEVRTAVSFPLQRYLRWSPIPNAHNLSTLCALLRPKKIESVIVTNVPKIYPIPDYLHKFTANYHRPERARCTHDVFANLVIADDTESLEAAAAAAAVPISQPTVGSILQLTKKRRPIYEYIDDSEPSN